MKKRVQYALNAAQHGLTWQEKRTGEEKRSGIATGLHFFGASGLKEVQRYGTF